MLCIALQGGSYSQPCFLDLAFEQVHLRRNATGIRKGKGPMSRDNIHGTHTIECTASYGDNPGLWTIDRLPNKSLLSLH